jgi:hypothetical protein
VAFEQDPNGLSPHSRNEFAFNRQTNPPALIPLAADYTPVAMMGCFLRTLQDLCWTETEPVIQGSFQTTLPVAMRYLANGLGRQSNREAR